MSEEKRTVIWSVPVPPSMVEAADAFQAKHGYGSRSEFIRRAIALMLGLPGAEQGLTLRGEGAPGLQGTLPWTDAAVAVEMQRLELLEASAAENAAFEAVASHVLRELPGDVPSAATAVVRLMARVAQLETRLACLETVP